MKKTLSKSHGFTLIEVMITVAIVGILASVAYPSYLEQIYKSKRATAATSVLECAATLERRFTMNSTFETTDCDDISNNDDYTITVAVSCVSNGNNNCFDITATSLVTDDTACRTMTLNHLGVKEAKKADGTTVNTETCWRTS